MIRSIFVCLLTTAVQLTVSVVKAQQTARIPRIGFVAGSREGTSIGAFQRGLRNLGYIDGKHIQVEYRYAEGNVDRIPTLVNELVQLKVDVLFVTTLVGIRAAKEATKTLPIVMVTTQDPVATGIIDSLAHPGGNITGVTTLTRDLNGKRLELLRELLRGQAEAVLVLNSSVFTSHRTQIAELAAKSRLPVTYYRREFVEDGGLMSYGESFTDLSRRAATYVDKILKGAKPADLPVEQPTKFELVINLKTAKQIGLTIPPDVLLRADKVIK